MSARRCVTSALLLAGALAVCAPSVADTGIPALTVQSASGGGQTYTLTLQILALMTAITLLPALVLMMTGFTRIVIVLGILRQALGAGQTPPNQVLIGLALFLTLFVMSPVITQINDEALQPYVAGSIDAVAALDKAIVPLKKFMLNQTRESDIATFVRISGGKGYATPEAVPLTVLVPAFVALASLDTAHTGFATGPALVLSLVFMVIAADIGAYFVGRQFGRRKLAPRVSPGKTWEGAGGGLALVALVAWAWAVHAGVPAGTFVAVGVAVGIFSVVGDLTESMFKRASGLKDSGVLLPGHGGLLDRIDSVTAAAPLYALVLGAGIIA